MTFSEKYLPLSRQRYFTFFASDGDPIVDWDDELEEQFSPSFAFILDKIRVHLSSVHASAVSFTVTVSHHIDSAYNEILISQAMLGVKDVVYQADPNRYFHFGDTLSCNMHMSAMNTFGLEISGWAISVPSRR